MPDKTIKTQYYQEDLAELLSLGSIVTMYICDDGRGRDVLRITSNPKPAEEFKTVRATGKQKPPARKAARKKQMPSEQPSHPKMDPGTRDPGEGLGSRNGKGFGAWISKPMKRPDEW